MPATTTHTPFWSNNCRRCLITRRRSLNYVLLTLQSNLKRTHFCDGCIALLKNPSTCLVRRVVSLPNSDLPAPPIYFATTLTPNHPLQTTTHGSSCRAAVSPGLCKYGESSRTACQPAKCHQLANTRSCIGRKATTFARERATRYDLWTASAQKTDDRSRRC